jgi:DnaK suppressor protein
MVGKKNIQKMKDLFEKQRAEDLSAIERLEREARTTAGNDPEDAGDKSVTNYSKELLFQRLSSNRARLRKLDAAMQRMRLGNFGICSNCSAEIPLKRLEAMPWTEYCRNCQEDLENGQPTPAKKLHEQLESEREPYV